METYNLAWVTKKVYESGWELFTLTTLRNLFEINKPSSLFSIIKRLEKNGVLIKIERNKYILANYKTNNFALANFLYQPSYISFESALNFYGILPQFPYETTSATPRKTCSKKFENKHFAFYHLKKILFWGYEKKENYLIAEAEKALLDQLYLASKGLKTIHLDEYDLSIISKTKIKQYIKNYPKTPQFKKGVHLLQKFITI